MTAPAVPSDLETYLASNEARFQKELFEFLRIPSVSVRSEHVQDVRRAAEWVASRLNEVGVTTKVHSTSGHPVVVGEWRGAGANAPTVLIYGHYDVQPPEPLELWSSPPFEPQVRDAKIFARGSVDDKGQLFVHLKALEAHLKSRGKLPVNVVVVAEGEEECGSTNLGPFVASHAKELACDAIVISDSAMFAPGMPSILSSLRGLAYFQLNARGPSSDLHSGMYGGAVVNPATALARVIASFHDATGKIAIPGFYDRVRTWPDAVRTQMRGLPFDDARFQSEIGVRSLGGEPGFTTLEKLWTRPTVEVNGMLAGYTGEGAKTVLPGEAMAKVSCRLVPDQDPEEIERLFREHVKKNTPAGVTIEIEYLHGGKPWRAELDGPLYDAARRALQAAFGREPLITGEGGSIPVVDDLTRHLNAPVLLMGFGLPGENAHAPDEWMSVENLTKGMRAAAVLYDELKTRS